MAEPILEVCALELWRGEHRLFRGLDFQLEAGQLAVVTGRNGAGKTTLLRTLAGLSVPAGGSANTFGEPAARLSERQRRNVLFQGHLDGLKMDLTVLENLKFWDAMGHGSSDLPGLLDRVGLAAHGERLVRHLSAGQRRRAALARLGVSTARLWLLDEPLTNLDEEGRALVETWVDERLRDGGAAVIATHAGLGIPGASRVEIGL